MWSSACIVVLLTAKAELIETLEAACPECCASGYQILTCVRERHCSWPTPSEHEAAAAELCFGIKVFNVNKRDNTRWWMGVLLHEVSMLKP
eukprot:2578753-Amphidinium_carterae.1